MKTRSQALMTLAGGFALAWLVLMAVAAQQAGGYTREQAMGAWLGVVSWFMLGGAILATVAAVATLGLKQP